LVHGDRTATQIALRNLVENAIKYSNPQGSGPQSDDAGFQLELKLCISTSENGFFCVSVEDNGVGFSDPALVFLDGGEMRTDSGFGLLGVRRLIHSRGGRLAVNNRAQSDGAEVSFSLPGWVRAPAEDTLGLASEVG